MLNEFKSTLWFLPMGSGVILMFSNADAKKRKADPKSPFQFFTRSPSKKIKRTFQETPQSKMCAKYLRKLSALWY